jgi:hypothetical protein
MSAANVVIVDDDPATAANAIAGNLRRLGLAAEAVKPEQVSLGHLEDADLILVDYALDEWVGPRDEALAGQPAQTQMVASRPRDGLALAAVIRSLLPEDRRLRAVALLSGQLHELVKDFSPSVTEHAAARLNGIDWAFAKSAIPGLPDLSRRIESFALALEAVQRSWLEDHDDREGKLVEMLELDQSIPWFAPALGEVHAAQPPINQYAEASHGLSIVRWLAQRILPYPCFLLDSSRLAMSCGVEPDAFEGPRGEQELESAFGACLYTGPLRQFLGPRWWRAGVQHEIRDGTGDTVPGPETAAFLSRRTGHELPVLQPATSVLAIDEALNPIGPVAREDAVRVRPDDWPAFAQSGWMERWRVEEDRALLDLVDPADRALVGEEPS